MTSYCNIAVRRISEGMGYFGFTPAMLARNMIEIMSIDTAWTEDTIERAHLHAMRGGLSVIGLDEYPHSHVAVIYPAPMEDSGSWGCPVPILANVGKTNGIMKASAVFKAADRSLIRCFLYGVPV